jgi:molybdopterin synthase sulfur carrier subunit
MPHVRFTQNIQRHIACPPRDVLGSTVRQAMEDYFTTNDKARGYVLEETGALRKHMAIFINGKPIHDRESLSDAVADGATIDVFQALSGG